MAAFPQELVGSTQPDRNWRGVIIALMVIATIFAFITAAVFFLDPDRIAGADASPTLYFDGSGVLFSEENLSGGIRGADNMLRDGLNKDEWTAWKLNRSNIPNRMKLDNLWQLSVPPVESKWFNGAMLTKDLAGNIIAVEPVTNVVSVLFPASTVTQQEEYSISADGEYILIARSTRRRYRYSSEILYVVRDKEGGEYALFSTTSQASFLAADPTSAYLQNAVWSPTGHKIGFVYQNDVYFKNDPKDVRAIRISSNGAPDVIYNGIADWVYEEEVLEAHNALWWSPQSSFLAYATFDDTPVGNYTLVSYGNLTKSWCCDETQYPELRTLKYPKPGTPNPKASITVVDTRQNALVVLNQLVPSDFVKEDPLLCQVAWPNDTLVYTQWLNRDQNVLRAYVHDFSTIRSGMSVNATQGRQLFVNLVLQEKDGWISGHSAPFFFANLKSDHYLLVLPDTRTAERRHAIAQFRLQRLRHNLNQIPKFITNSSNHVLDIVGYSVTDQMLYFTGTGGITRNQHLFRMNLTLPLSDAVDGNYYREECLTCADTTCTFNEITMNMPNASVFIRKCSGGSLQVPVVELREAKTNNLLKVLEKHDRLKAALDDISMPTKQFFSIPLSANSGPGGRLATWEAQVELVLPPFYGRSKHQKYPLVVSVYGGPETDYVLSQYSVGFDEYLAGAHDIVVARIDGRGSGRSGAKLAFEIYRNLGENEVRDQILVAQYLLRKYKFLDRSKVGIWGWSYGGYVAARALLLDENNLWTCAVSVAPVTEWLYYDSVYTERYLQTANMESKDSVHVYRDSSVIQQPKERLIRMGQADYLLIHGTADECSGIGIQQLLLSAERTSILGLLRDNVHFMHTAMLAKKLQSYDIPFRMHIFPDQAHSIGYSTLSVYKHITSHFEQCFGLATQAQIRQELWLSHSTLRLAQQFSPLPPPGMLDHDEPSVANSAKHSNKDVPLTGERLNKQERLDRQMKLAEKMVKQNIRKRR